MWKNRKRRKIGRGLTVLAALLLTLTAAGPESAALARTERNLRCESRTQEAQQSGEGLTLYAGAAVLMDADSGRVLYDKNGETPMPMASTTKIMTCIVALENGNMEDTVTASAYAAAQPKVHLGMVKGRTYRMEDLMYSMMLESYNDSAVAIAEHIGAALLNLPPAEERSREESRQAVAAFAGLMNQKARDIDCFDTFFITPNGLDAQTDDGTGEQRAHSTTAQNLAGIMRYCIGQSSQQEAFLEITGTPAYSFTDLSGAHSYSCTNHNAFLQMMDGALSGKTGFTNDAGYCYVGALKQDGKCFTVALLACGWPGNKTWKWQDTKRLMSYGVKNYEQRSFEPPLALRELDKMRVSNGQTGRIDGQAFVGVELEEQPFGMLMQPQEKIEVRTDRKSELTAPVAVGEEVGSISYLVDGKIWKTDYFHTQNSVEERDFLWCCKMIGEMYLLRL